MVDGWMGVAMLMFDLCNIRSVVAVVAAAAAKWIEVDLNV